MKSCALLGLCFYMGLSLPVAADIDEARQLARAGRTDQALAHITEVLRAQPGDIAARLLRGVLLSSSGQSDAAIDAFLSIVEDRPDLPEPHNNLAVLYAAQGRYDEARATLKHAIKLQPDYDVAHENLGDVYLKLAFLAFNSAEQINPNNANAAAKAAATDQVLNESQTRRSISSAAREARATPRQPSAPTASDLKTEAVSAPTRPTPSSEQTQPTPAATKPNTASTSRVERCVKLPKIRPPSRAKDIVHWFNSHGMRASISNSPSDSSTGLAYRVLLPAEPDGPRASTRIAQLRAQGVSDLIVISRGEHANGISLGVFAKRSGAERRQAALADKNIHAQVVEHRTSAALDSAAVVARGTFDARAFTRQFADINFETSLDIDDCR